MSHIRMLRGHEEASSTMINQEALSSKINPGEVLMFSLRGHGRALIGWIEFELAEPLEV